MSFSMGEIVRVSAIFTNTAGAVADPTSVFFKYRNPGGTITSLTYGVDAALVKDSTGNYHVDIDANDDGPWWWRFYSTGTGQTAEEGKFAVARSVFD